VGGGLMAEEEDVVLVKAVSFAFAGLGVRLKRGGGGCVCLFFEAFLVKEYWRE
jgi:hypothetical protein